MKPPTNRTAARTLASDGLGRRLAMAWLMVVSILIVSLASSLSVHAATNGSLAIGGQTIETQVGISDLGSADRTASIDDSWDSPADCADHCASHGLSLPAPVSPLQPTSSPTMVWRLTATPLMADGSSARLERPPRL
jgi:hypothetical protein